MIKYLSSTDDAGAIKIYDTTTGTVYAMSSPITPLPERISFTVSQAETIMHKTTGIAALQNLIQLKPLSEEIRGIITTWFKIADYNFEDEVIMLDETFAHLIRKGML